MTLDITNIRKVSHGRAVTMRNERLVNSKKFFCETDFKSTRIRKSIWSLVNWLIVSWLIAFSFNRSSSFTWTVWRCQLANNILAWMVWRLIKWWHFYRIVHSSTICLIKKNFGPYAGVSVNKAPIGRPSNDCLLTYRTLGYYKVACYTFMLLAIFISWQKVRRLFACKCDQLSEGRNDLLDLICSTFYLETYFSFLYLI